MKLGTPLIVHIRVCRQVLAPEEDYKFEKISLCGVRKKSAYQTSVARNPSHPAAGSRF